MGGDRDTLFSLSFGRTLEIAEWISQEKGKFLGFVNAYGWFPLIVTYLCHSSFSYKVGRNYSIGIKWLEKFTSSGVRPGATDYY